MGIVRGRMAKALVLRGRFEKTSGGLRADGLMKNKRGKVVSKRKSALYAKTTKDWIDSCMSAPAAELEWNGVCQWEIISRKSFILESKGSLRRKEKWKGLKRYRLIKLQELGGEL